MARDPYIEQRLINWGRWRAGQHSGGLGFAATNWSAFNAGDRAGPSRAVIPDGEDNLTDQAVTSLAIELQDALASQYVLGGSVQRKAARLSCHEQTFRARLVAGERGVSAWLSERDRVQRAERERVEAMHASISMGLADRERLAIEERRRTDKILKFNGKRVRRVE